MLRQTYYLLVVAFTLAGYSSAQAKTLYVNNRLGSDQFDGVVESSVSAESGPVKTINRALALATFSDTIIVAKTAVPYYETLTIIGLKHSGTIRFPFTIISQGAIVSGAKPIPRSGWKKVGVDLWKVSPYRKGTYQLTRNGKALSELRRKPKESWYKVPKLAENQWCHWHGAVYFKSERFVEPGDENFALAQASTGATILKVDHVKIRGLIFQHFRVDGVQVHNAATNVTLDNVGTYENGRAGLTVSGTSKVLLRGCSVRRNRDHSILLKGFGVLAVEESDWDQAPTDQQ
jgi:hypothetical protein